MAPSLPPPTADRQGDAPLLLTQWWMFSLNKPNRSSRAWPLNRILFNGNASAVVAGARPRSSVSSVGWPEEERSSACGGRDAQRERNDTKHRIADKIVGLSLRRFQHGWPRPNDNKTVRSHDGASKCGLSLGNNYNCWRSGWRWSR